MRKLIVFLGLLPGFAFAGYTGTVNHGSFFKKKEKCEAVLSEPCIQVSANIDRETHDLSDVEVDDYSKPVYAAKRQSVACSGKDDCLEKIDVLVDVLEPETGETVKQYYCTDFGFSPIISVGLDEVYCTKQTGWAKKLVKKWIKNQAKHDAKEVAKLDEKNKFQKIKDDISKDWNGLNDNQKLEALRKALKRLYQIQE